MSAAELETLVSPLRTCARSNRPPLWPAPTFSVLHLINGEHFSGAERVQQLLGKRLPECGVAVDFACLKPGKFLQHSGLSPDRVFSVPMHGRFDRDIARRIHNLLMAGNYQLLHAHTPRSAMIASRVAARSKLPWVYHVHSPTSRDSSRRIINRVNDLVERWSLRNCARLITVSRSLRREFLRRGMSRSLLRCVPNGVPDLSPIDPWQRLEQRRWRLGMVALFRPRKGLEVLLEALRHEVLRSLDLEVEIIGGFETAEYEKLIHRLVAQYRLESIVRFTGFTDNVPGRLSQLDGLVLPSLYGEGMPMVVLEALAGGVPVIATRVEGTPEIIRHGREGWLAEPRNAASLAAAVEAFTRDRGAWAQMSEAAVVRHRDHYSDRRMAEKIAGIYRQLLPIFPRQS
jgi:glycosyltransferase involved in cell wall biosynthesis